MKNIFRNRRHRNPHKHDEQKTEKQAFFEQQDAQENKSPFFSPSPNAHPIQTKLKVGAANDPMEKEADTVADQVVDQTASTTAVQQKELPGIQKVTLATPAEDEKLSTAEQRMEKDKLIQEKPEEEEVQKMDEEETVQKQADEEELQKMEDEEAVQKQGEEEEVQKMEEEEAVQKQEGEEELQKQEEEEPIQTKVDASGTTRASSGLSQKIKGKAGSGRKLPTAVRSEMESGIGADFSEVNIHTDRESADLNKSLHAQAFTHGKDIYFNEGKYRPETSAGKHLLAHELTHVVQQDAGERKVQRAPGPWRYTPPATVTRSIEEIQNIVGTTPDGIYGPKTRDRVKAYQTVLTSKGLYAGTVDGKWGDLTEVANVAFATLPTRQRRGYNCSGYAFKQFRWINLIPTKAILAGMTKQANCNDNCSPYHYKFWFWEVEVRVVDARTGRASRFSNDFHIVGAQTDSTGAGPALVSSKNGQRPVEPLGPPLSFAPRSGPALSQLTGNPVPNMFWQVRNVRLTCFCSRTLP